MGRREELLDIDVDGAVLITVPSIVQRKRVLAPRTSHACLTFPHAWRYSQSGFFYL